MPVVTRFEIEGPLLIVPDRYGDERGWFAETWKQDQLDTLTGSRVHFVQDNQSLSVARHTLRGLHFQAPPFAQAKLVRAVAGAVLDVAVDIRRGSPTYGRHVKAVLTADAGEQLFVPEGFAHGFLTLGSHVQVAYKVSGPYDRASEGGLLWNAPELGIDWGVSGRDVKVHPRDAAFPGLEQLNSPF
jgi:dTDP-4-dehydrorhamnose 3,5-epimerase